jgi:hypothetical protein
MPLPPLRYDAVIVSRVCGLCHEICRRRVGQNLATMQYDDPVGVGHLVALMRGPQHRDSALLAHRQNELDQIAAACRIEANRRLVHQQNGRLRLDQESL